MLLSFDWFLILFFVSKCLADLNIVNALSKISTRPLENLVDKPLSFIDTATQDGYRAEKHDVTTEDGYILTLHRILTKTNCTKKRPVLLMHGVLQGSDCFIDAGSEAPAYVFSEECYDVWLGNFRGTYHSRKHVFLNPDKDLKFWQFDLQQMGKYDLPALIDYVLNKTNSKKLIYSGFSQGGGAFFVMNSERPKYAAKVSLFIGLAPSGRLLHTKSVSYRALCQSALKFRTTLEAVGIWEVLTKGFPFSALADTLCQLDPLGVLCNLESFVVDSPHPDSITVDIEKKFYQHVPAGVSVQILAYYGQEQNSERFQKFDFGPVQNLKAYGSLKPPEYDLDAVKVPSVIFHGSSDSIVDANDVDWLVDRLPMVLDYVVVKDPQWNHLDMTYSRYWKQTIFESLQKYLTEYSYDDDVSS